jgi:uncharacterized integral membrane protein (TIGR00698 family)
VLPGLLVAAILAEVAYGAVHVMGSHAFLGVQTGSLLLGLLVANLRPPVAVWEPGLAIAKRQLLRIGVILFGLRLTWNDLVNAGPAVVMADVVMLASTFWLANRVGRSLGLSKDRATLIGAGAAVCGASAVLATAQTIKAEPADTALAVTTVMLGSTSAFFLYPLLAHLGGLQGVVPATDLGAYIGATVHEVGQVVAISSAIDPAVVGPALVAKMGRVALLAPFLLWLALHRRNQTQAAAPAAQALAPDAGPAECAAVEVVEGAASAPTPALQGPSWRGLVPWFPAAFVAVIGLNSGLRAAGVTLSVAGLDTALLAVAMAALGLGTRLASLRAAGRAPLTLAGVLFVWLTCGGALTYRLALAIF